MAKFFTPTKLSENIRETPEGYLLCLAVPIARTGWQVYGEGETPLDVGPDGTVRVHRDAKEVFRPQTIASYQGKSITIKHPQEFVNPNNWQALTRGSAQNVRKGEEKDEDGEESLLGDLLITEAMAIQLVKNGLREVSCGYEAEYEQTGEGEGRQFNIVGNHIALVEQGRAGQSYAINDHKGKSTMSKLAESMKKLFGKAVDEALEEENKAKDEDKKDDPKKEDAKDEDEKKDDKKSEDAAAYDELVKICKDLGAKIEAMGKGKDAKADSAAEPKKEDEPAKDEGADAALEDRLSALEAAVKKLLEGKTGDEEEEEESEESEDDDFDNSELTGDTAARIEILSPGLKPLKGQDVRVKALEAAYGTKEGKEVLEALSGGKKPVFDSAEKISTLFVAASEVLKANRGTGLERTKNPKAFDTGDSKSETMTAEKLNEINAAHWAK